jgi:DNA-binding GntR family transcriptional regulator
MIRFNTLKGNLVKVVTEAILSNKFKPGDRVNESELARQFQISRAPIREALQQLEQQGLLMKNPRRGMFVVKLTQEDIQQINSVRLVLEAEALRLCRRNLTPKGERKLTELVQELESQGEGPADKQYRLDLEFHRALWSMSGNEYLERALIGLMAPLFAHAVLTTPKEKKIHTIIISHRWMLDFVNGKVHRPAEALLLEHIRVAWPDLGSFSSFTHKPRQQ